MIYVNAGHPPPVVLRKNGEIEALESGGVPLGMFDSPRYFEGFAELEEGDLMVLYTDGIDESSNAHDEQYGRGRLMATLGSVRTQSAEAICRHVMDDVRSFSFGSQDDRTLVVMSEKGAKHVPWRLGAPKNAHVSSSVLQISAKRRRRAVRGSGKRR